MPLKHKKFVKCAKFLKISIAIQKLDGVGHVDNRPSTNQLHYFVQLILRMKKKIVFKKKKKIM